MNALLSVRAVEKSFGSIRALGPIDVELRAGERVGLIGPNGSGKTTLINCITGLLAPDAGAIIFKGTDITSEPAHRRVRRGLSRSFQIPRPFAGMTVLENLLVPLDYLAKGSQKEIERACEILRSVGLIARRDHLSETLSQLELRKLELARALVAEPEILIADEAMAGLSEGEIDDIISLLFLLNERGVAIVMIEHIMHAVMRFSERVICLQTGRIVAEGTPSEITGNPIVQQVYFGEQTYH
jgi:branched-chain amino acid transport system ATP-binding protein